MGYKPGMSLGKKREGKEEEAIKEPISIDLKTNRTGLGHDQEEKRKSRERVEAHYAHMAKRAKIHVRLSSISFVIKKRSMNVLCI